MSPRVGYRSKFLAFLPRDPEHALTLRELARISGVPLLNWSVWSAQTAPSLPWVRRRNISRTRRPTYAYWYDSTAARS